MKDYWNNLTPRSQNLLKLIPALLIVLALPLTAWMVQQTQNIQQNAALISSGPITATSGQVIRGVKISNPLGPCITVSNVSNVIIDNVELGPCAGNGVKISGSGATGIQVTNSFISTGRSGSSSQNSGVGVFIFGGSSNILVQGNTFERNESSVYAETASGVKINRNRSKNPLGPFPRGQHAQFNNVNGGEINDNFGEAIAGQSDQEDAINVFNSDNIVVARNYIIGGDSPSGCGVIADWSGGTNNQLIDNIVIRTAQCGVAIAGGTNHVIRGNKVLDTNITGGSGNIGIYVANYSGGVCSGHSVVNNIVSNLLPNGTYNDYYNAGSCGTVTTSGNIFGSTARSLLTPENQKLPTPTPLPTIGAVPATSTPAPTTTPVFCGTSLQTVVNNAAASSVINLTGCTYSDGASINKPITLVGASVSKNTTDAFNPVIGVTSDDVTIDKFNFAGGGSGVSVYGKDRVKVKNSTFRNLTGSSIAVWGASVGADDVVFEGNNIVQTKGIHTSPIMGRGSENNCDGGIFNKRLIVRNNYMDQGNRDIGWFGLELKCHTDALIEGNEFKGGHFLTSFPDSPRTTIRNNKFHLNTTGGAYAAVEIAGIPNVDSAIENNEVIGYNGATGPLVYHDHGSNNMKIRYNKVSDIGKLVEFAGGGGGSGHIITDNCLINVPTVKAGPDNPTNTTFANNGSGACSTIPTVSSAPTPTPITFVPTPTPTATSQACDVNAVGVNRFVGCLYDGTQFETLVSAAPSGNISSSPVQSTQTGLSFDWGLGTPNTSVGVDQWSIRWKGDFTFPAGTYTFTGGSDDGIRVRFNGVTKLDKWTGRAYTEDSFVHTFSAPTKVRIEIDYNELSNPAKVNFRWTLQSPTVTPTFTPTPVPNTPTPTVAPTLTPTPITSACDTNAIGNNRFAGCLYDGTQFDRLVSTAPLSNTLSLPVLPNQTALDFNWGSSSPNSAVGTEHWSIRWKGNFTFPAGTYTFIGGSDDGIRVRFNGATKINVWTGRAYGESSFTETFSVPTTVKIEIDYNEYGVPGKVNFRWTGQNPAPTSTPTTAPTPTPTPPPTVCTADAKLCPDGSYVPRVPPTCQFAQCPNTTPTPTVAPTLTPTPTSVPSDTVLVFNLGLDGIGSTGDNSNPSDGSGSNKNPLHKTRNINIQVFDSSNNLAAQKTGSVLYNPSTGKFTGSVDLGNSFKTGFYIVKVKSDGYSTKQISGIQNITASQTNQISYINLITGDINKDNILNILDYNIFLSCSVFSSNQSTCNSNSSFKALSDLNDDGSVDQNDYNLFIRELSTQVGQ